MAAPRWFSRENITAYATEVWINPGNWRQYGGDPLIDGKWMAVVFVDGVQVHGTVPTMPEVPAATIYPDELPIGTPLLLDLSAYTTGSHTVTTNNYAASFFEGWGDHPDDSWEWGNVDTVTQSIPYSVSTTFPGTGTAPPVPPEGPPDGSPGVGGGGSGGGVPDTVYSAIRVQSTFGLPWASEDT